MAQPAPTASGGSQPGQRDCQLGADDQGEQVEPRAARTGDRAAHAAGEREHRERDRDRENRRGQRLRDQARAQVVQHAAGVEPVVHEDRPVEIREPAGAREVREGAKPHRGADRRDHADVAEGASARVSPRRRGQMRARQQSRRGDDDGLVERAPGEEGAHHDHAQKARAIRAKEQGKRPHDARVDEDLGVGLVGLQPQVSGHEGPKGGAPESGHPPADDRGARVDAEKRSDRGDDVQHVDCTGSVAREQDRGGVGDVERRRLVVPHVGIERAAGQELVPDHGGARDVSLERLVVRVEPRDHDQRGQGAERQDHPAEHVVSPSWVK